MRKEFEIRTVASLLILIVVSPSPYLLLSYSLLASLTIILLS